MTHSLSLGLIGNGQISALVDGDARFVWSCMPRFDGDPVFCQLLDDNAEDGAGTFAIELANQLSTEQRYVPNTAILETTLADREGGAIKIVDFAPRFRQDERFYRPVALVRQIIRVAGNPRVRIILKPRYEHGQVAPTLTHGSNHIRYVGSEQTLRLTCDAPIAGILEERYFTLRDRLHLFLGPDESFVGNVADECQTMLRQTKSYWLAWVQGLSIPFEWQEAVIRAAITLKLSAYSDTGAIVAAMTTSIPEAPNSGRNWDYRYCWLRDSYFVVQALNRLGATRTMADYISYVVDVAENHGVDKLQPVYSISGESDLTERIVDELSGYQGMGPVRVGNQAFEQVQNDVYGSVVLAATRMFCDVRLADSQHLALFKRLEKLGDAAVARFDKPDAGLWEYRGRKNVHTFSSAMCWAACDRLARIAEWLGESARVEYWKATATRLHEEISEQGWNSQLNSFIDDWGGERLDASLLLLPQLGFLRADDPRFEATLSAVENSLRQGHHMMRYAMPDDFGTPDNAFNICTFWYIDALASVGRDQEAREIFETMLAARNPLGLMSEDISFDGTELWGNFPQTYSMVGLINSALRLSKSWEEGF